jgi:hypothetical protein
VAVASSTRRVRSVHFLVDRKQVSVDRSGSSDVFTGTWNAAFALHGRHVLTAVATDAVGRTFSATRNLRVCH